VSLVDQGGADGRLRRVFDHPACSLGAGLSAPIFDAGQLAAGRDLAEAEREERLANCRFCLRRVCGFSVLAVRSCFIRRAPNP
jgi:outer membrane protein TolC